MAHSENYILSVMLSHSKDIIPTPETAYVFSMDSILSLTVTESILGLLPKIEIVMTNNGGILDLHPILDKDVIHIRFNNDIDIPNAEIVASFNISSFRAVSDSTGNIGNVFSIVGYMATSNAFSPHLRKTYPGTSDTVLQLIAIQMGLKFKKDITGVDNVNWYQDCNNFTFMKHIANRAYVPQDGVFVYGTLDGTINYTSFKTKNAMPPRFTALYNRERVQNSVLLPDELLYMYYDSYDIVNLTDMYNNVSNYGGTHSFYDGTTYVTTPIVGARSGTELQNIDVKYFGTPVFAHNVGIISDKKLQNTIFKGRTQNDFVRYGMFSNSIAININNSTAVKLFDKVDINIPSTFYEDSIAEPYSGNYMVASISHSLVSGVGYAKRIMLCRNGINKNISTYVNPEVI